MSKQIIFYNSLIRMSCTYHTIHSLSFPFSGFQCHQSHCSAITTINFKTFSSPPKETLCPLAFTLFLSILPVLGNHSIQFLSQGVCLFQTFHLNRVLQCATLCDWLLSLSIMISRCSCCIMYFFLFPNSIQLNLYIMFQSLIHQLLGI